MRTLKVAIVLGVASVMVGEASSPEPVTAPEAQAKRPVVGRRWYEGPGLAAFREGYRAWEQRDWQTAKSQMRRARDADQRGDQPEANVKTGGAGWISPYVPSYYLCVARCRVDHCTESANEILRMIKDADRKLQEEYRKACGRQVECPAGRR